MSDKKRKDYEIAYMYSIIIIPILIILDQLTKWLISKNISLGMNIIVIDGFFDLVHSRNRGGIFGIFQNGGIFFLITSLLALIFLIFLYIRFFYKKKVYRYALTFILAGAIGNILDRVRLGYVIDFIRLHIGKHFYWPSFNIADVSIVIGAFILLGYIIFKRDTTKGETHKTIK